jgi:hypothetical protein
MALLRLIQLDALMQRCDLLSQLNNPLLSERIHFQNYTLAEQGAGSATF